MLATSALSLVALLVLPAPQPPQKPPPAPPRAPFAAFDVPTSHVATSRDDLSAAIVSMATAHRIDAVKRSVEALPEAGNVASVALGASGAEYALGLRDGRIVYVAADGARREFRVDPKANVLGITWHSGFLAWWTANSRGGVLDLATGKQRIEPALEVSICMSWPSMEFTADGLHVCWRQRSNRPEAAQYIVVQSLATGAEVARLPVYATMRSGLLVVGNQVVHSVRAGTAVWHLDAFDTTNGTTRRLDANLRGGHFVDLAAAANGRFLVEGDFEEPGVARYCLDGAGVDHKLLGESAGFLGCGTLRDGDAAVDTVILRPARHANELTALRLDDGNPVRVPLPGIGARAPERVGTVLGGAVLWTVLQGKGDRRIEFFALP